MLELSTIKKHCRVEPDFIDDDALLTLYQDAAARYVEDYTQRKLYRTAEQIPTDEDGQPIDDYALVYNSAVHAAMLLIIGHWYANREAVNIGNIVAEIPMGTEALLRPYRVMGV